MSVRKKDGSLKCCIGYRQLNSVTKKDAYALPRIDSCLDAMASATLFSTFDLRSSYHQVVVVGFSKCVNACKLNHFIKYNISQRKHEQP